jgi:hypothetical protein
MSNYPPADNSRPDRDPDPAAPPPSAYQPPPPPDYQAGYAKPPSEYPPTSQFPPVNYAPAGQEPDFGHGYPPPGYPPPGYPAMQPDRPPRRSNVPLIALIVAVSLLLCGGVVTASVMAVRAAADRAKEAVKPITELPTAVPELPELPGLPTDLPGLPTDLPTAVPGSGRKLTVTYEVSGDGPAQILYVDKLGGTPTRLDDVKLPWKFSVEVETPALLSVIAMRLETGDGEISCRALVDGEEVKQRTSSSGTFATASCTHFALD